MSEAWDRLTESMCKQHTLPKTLDLTLRPSVYPFSIPSRETLENIGADPDTSVELPAEYGGGYEGILGMTHQLHCIVREHLYPA